MASGTNKRGTGFGLGLTAGLVLGGFFVWLLITYYPFSKDRFLDELSLNSDSDKPGTSTTKKLQALRELTEDTLSFVSANPDSSDIPDSLEIFSFLDTVDWGLLDSLGGYSMDTSFPDKRRTAAVDTPLTKPALLPRDIRTAKGDPVVKRDELIDVRQVAVTELVVDSLGRIARKTSSDSPYRVDFWRSPINYKGYRKTGRNIVVYGIVITDSVELEKSGPNLYLVDVDRRYLITETYDFKHLIEVRGKRR
jgi:hypothetical protein